MKKRGKRKREQSGKGKNDSGQRKFVLLWLPVLLTAGFMAELYLFPEILAPDCVRVVMEESGAETGTEETEMRSGFRFYESKYRIAWKYLACLSL